MRVDLFDFDLPADLIAQRPARPRDAGFRGGGTRDVRPTSAERAEQILLRLPVGVVVLASDFDIALINAHARQLLGIHGTAVGQDFVHIADEIPSQPLREAIDSARNGETSSLVHRVAAFADGDGQRILRLSFHLHAADADRGLAQAVVVVVEDISAARMELGRPMTKGIIMCGNTTTSRSGTMGSVSMTSTLSLSRPNISLGILSRAAPAAGSSSSS